MKVNYPEIQKLNNLKVSFGIKINHVGSLDNLSKVELKIKDKSFSIYIHDEYNDLIINNPLLNLCLVLRELELYKDCSDFLDWCNNQNVIASNEDLRGYYMKLDKTYYAIENIIGQIDSQISDLDFQLNAGAIAELRRFKTL